jgi:hypothetical protein
MDIDHWEDIEQGDPGHPILELLGALLLAIAILGLVAFIIASSW